MRNTSFSVNRDLRAASKVQFLFGPPLMDPTSGTSPYFLTEAQMVTDRTFSSRTTDFCMIGDSTGFTACAGNADKQLLQKILWARRNTGGRRT